MEKRYSYLTLEDIITPNFFKSVQAIVVQSGNGTGKTTACCDLVQLVVELSSTKKLFERVYFLESSHQACENVVRKLTQRGIKVIWYEGIERVCRNRKHLEQFIKLGSPPALACRLCHFWKHKHKQAYKILEDLLTDVNVDAVRASSVSYFVNVCIQPLLRKLVLDPTWLEKQKLKLAQIPVIIMPLQFFLTNTVIERWREYAKRQSKVRRILQIVDEADNYIYQGLRIELQDINPDNIDYQVAKEVSLKTRKYEKLVSTYANILKLLRNFYTKRIPDIKFVVKRIAKMLEEIEAELKSAYRRIPEIVAYIYTYDYETNFVKIVIALYNLYNISDLYYAMLGLDYVNDTFILTDYNFTFRTLLDTNYPFKHFWKIVISATFPVSESVIRIGKSNMITESAILYSYLISPRVKQVFKKITVVEKSYKNVYVIGFTLFDYEYGLVNRNVEVVRKIRELQKQIKSACELYYKVFRNKVRGVLVWLGNKKQFLEVTKQVENVCKRFKVEYSRGRDYFKTYINTGVERCSLIFSYCGSRFSRSIDLPEYNISMVVSPLLRPPRRTLPTADKYDSLDRCRAVAEAIQSAMRIVRSPTPSEPKLICLEQWFFYPSYIKYAPSWFIELINNSLWLFELRRRLIESKVGQAVSVRLSR